MAWQDTTRSAKWVQKLDDGTTATGTKRTVNCNMGALDVATWDPNKAGAIVNALGVCLEKSIYRSVRTLEVDLAEE